MPLDGNGTFTRSNGVNTGSGTWAADAAAGTDILASRHDTHDQEFAAALSLATYRDGRATATGNHNMGGFRIENIGNPNSSDDAFPLSYLTSIYLPAAGTFTPSLEASSGSATHSTQTGFYKQIGDDAYWISILLTAAKNTLSGDLKITLGALTAPANNSQELSLVIGGTTDNYCGTTSDSGHITIFDVTNEQTLTAADIGASAVTYRLNGIYSF